MYTANDLVSAVPLGSRPNPGTSWFFCYRTFFEAFPGGIGCKPGLAAPARVDAVFISPMRMPLGGQKAAARVPESDPDSRVSGGGFAGSRSRHSRRRNDLMGHRAFGQDASPSWPGIG